VVCPQTADPALLIPCSSSLHASSSGIRQWCHLHPDSHGNGRREGTWARTLFLDKIWPEFEFLSKSLESSRLLLSRRHHPFTWTWDMNGWMSPASLTFHTDPSVVGTSSMGTHWAISYRMKPQSRVFHQRLPVWTG